MKLEVKNQRISITEREALVSSTVNVHTAEFAFDDTWAEHTPVAVFESGADILHKGVVEPEVVHN